VTLEVPPEEREAFWEKLYAEPGFGIWLGNFCEIGGNEKANAALSDFIAGKIRQRVKDPKVTEKLIPRDHGFGTRRVPLESGYFATSALRSASVRGRMSSRAFPSSRYRAAVGIAATSRHPQYRRTDAGNLDREGRTQCVST
jgi:hypothetical protein